MTNVVIALGNTEWEPQFISALGHPMLDISVQRRCLDAIDVRSAVRLLEVDAVILGDATLRVNEDCINDLRECNIQVIAISNDLHWWNSIGVMDVVSIEPTNLAASIQALASLLRNQTNTIVPPANLRRNLIAVTGFGGGSGRTTVARELSYVSATMSHQATVLVDADVVSPSLAIELDDDHFDRGLLQLARLAESRKLSDDTSRQFITPALERLDFVRGLPTVGRWKDLRSHALQELWRYLSQSFDVVIVDAGPVLDLDGSETAGGILPRRSACFLTSVDAATHVVVTCRADNVGISRLVRGYLDNEQLFADKEISVLLTHGSDLDKQAIHSIQRLTGIQSVAVAKSSTAFARATRDHSFASAFDRQTLDSFYAFLCETQNDHNAESGLTRQRSFLKGIRNSRAA